MAHSKLHTMEITHRLLSDVMEIQNAIETIKKPLIDILGNNMLQNMKPAGKWSLSLSIFLNSRWPPKWTSE